MGYQWGEGVSRQMQKPGTTNNNSFNSGNKMDPWRECWQYSTITIFSNTKPLVTCMQRQNNINILNNKLNRKHMWSISEGALSGSLKKFPMLRQERDDEKKKREREGQKGRRRGREDKKAIARAQKQRDEPTETKKETQKQKTSIRLCDPSTFMQHLRAETKVTALQHALATWPPPPLEWRIGRKQTYAM